LTENSQNNHFLIDFWSKSDYSPPVNRVCGGVFLENLVNVPGKVVGRNLWFVAVEAIEW
jgi:hypothetical protein